MTDKLTEFVGDIPDNYDNGLGPYIFVDYAADIARRAAALKPKRVLELAAGTGIVSQALRQALDRDVHLTVTDLNGPMLEIAKSKIGDAANTEFAVADAMQLDFPNSHFDVIVCQFGVMFFPDKQASMKEALRVLKPGGSYLFNTWGTLAENPFATVMLDMTDRIFPNNPPVFYNIPFSYPDPDEVRSDLMQSGFGRVAHDTIDLQKPVDDWAQFARGMVFGNPSITELQERGAMDPEDVLLLVEEELRARFGREPGTMPLRATVFHAQV